MTKIDLISGFLGAGKTTLLKKLISEALQEEQVVVIENEFGEIGIDKGFLQEVGIEVKEMNSGCICCSLVGDFEEALEMVVTTYHPDRIIIEPSGVGKLSDVKKAIAHVSEHCEFVLNSCSCVVDVCKYKMYMKNFKEFFKNQIEHADTILLSRTQLVDQTKLNEVVKDLQSVNDHATLITVPWDQVDATTLLCSMQEHKPIIQVVSECEHHHDHHHDHHHHHHHGDEVFESYAWEGLAPYTFEEVQALLDRCKHVTSGIVLRAKGMVETKDGIGYHFDYVSGECEIREKKVVGRSACCIIGTQLDSKEIASLLEGKC